MAKSQNNLEKQLAALEEFYAAGGLEIAAEPKRWAFPAPYIPNDDPKENLFAIYGSATLIDALNTKGCISESAQRPRVDTDAESKDYLDTALARAFLAIHPEINTHIPCRLFALGDNADEPTLAYLDTGKPVDEDSQTTAHPDSLCYLLLSAGDKMRFNIPSTRLTDAGPRMHLQANHYGREAGEFFILPLRRSMVESIARAHPGLIELHTTPEKNPRAFGDDMADAMQAILADCQNDSRFHKEPYKKEIGPNKRANPEQEPEVQPRAIADFLDELRPHVKGFIRTQQLNGSYATTLNVQPSAELGALVKEMSDPRYCTEARELSLTPILQGGHLLGYTINQSTYQHLKPLIDGQSIDEYIDHQNFSQKWVLPSNVKYPKPQPETPPNGKGKNKKKQTIEYTTVPESVHSLRLAWNSDGTTEQHWLIVEADSIQRGMILADRMSVARHKVGKITQENERPALVRVPISATMAEHLREDEAERRLKETGPKELNIDSEEAPYDSIDALAAAQRERASVTIPAPSQKSAPAPVQSKPVKRSEEEIRAAAEKIIFEQAVTAIGDPQIAKHPYVWAFVGDKKEAAKTDSVDPAKRFDQGRVYLGIKIHKDLAHEIDQKLILSGFKGRHDRRFDLVGKTGDFQLYKLSISRADALAWEKYLTPETQLPGSNGTPGWHYNQSSLQSALEKYYEMAEPPKEPVDSSKEAWRQVAKLAREGSLKRVDVLYDKATIYAELNGLKTELKALKKVAATAEVTEQIRNDRREKPRMPLSIGMVRQGAKLESLVAHHVGPTYKLGTEIAAMEKEISRFKKWLRKQKRDDDGNVIISNLVIADPPSSLSTHLHHLSSKPYQKPGARKNARGTQLLPGPTERVPGILADKKVMVGNREVSQPRDMLLIPVVPEFFDALRDHDPEVEVAPVGSKPWSRGRLYASLRGEYYVAPVEKPEEIRDYTYDAAANLRETLPRRDEFKNCADIVRYASIREEHEHQDLAKTTVHKIVDGKKTRETERLGERIHTQHAVMFRITDSRDAKRASTLIKQFEKARLLTTRKKYGELIEAPLPDDLLKAIHDRDDAAQQYDILNDSGILFHLQQIATGREESFHLTQATGIAREICASAQRGELSPAVLDLLETEGQIDVAKLGSAYTELNAINNALFERRNQATNRMHDLAVVYHIDETDHRMAPSIVADEKPLCYIAGSEKGIDLEELPALLPKQPGDKPVNFVVFLDINPERPVDKSITDAMKAFRPQPLGQGKRTESELQRRFGKTENIPLATFFAEAHKHYGLSAEVS